jgi:hypothetical protein
VLFTKGNWNGQVKGDEMARGEKNVYRLLAGKPASKSHLEDENING